MKNETKKVELLQNLYALRTSLSVMSVLKDKCEDVDKSVLNIQKEDTTCIPYKLKMDGLERDIARVQSEISQAKDNITNLKKGISDSKNSLKNKESIILNVLAIIGLVLLIPICVVLIYCFGGAWINMWIEDTGGADGVFYAFGKIKIIQILGVTFLFAIGSLGGLGATIVGLIASICKIVEKKTYENNLWDNIIENELSINTKKREISSCEQKIINYIKDAALNKGKLNVAEKELANKMDLERKKKIPIKEEFILLNSITESNFKDILDTRDWGNIDLIIYYVETSRADTLKEALQLVDEERRYQDITKLIINACSELGRVIYDGFNQLRADVNNGINLIVNRIDDFAQEQKIDNKIIADKLSTLATSVNFNNALQAKIANNSMQLVKDMQYMKEQSKLEHQNSSFIKSMIENEEIRRRNNL